MKMQPKGLDELARAILRQAMIDVQEMNDETTTDYAITWLKENSTTWAAILGVPIIEKDFIEWLNERTNLLRNYREIIELLETVQWQLIHPSRRREDLKLTQLIREATRKTGRNPADPKTAYDAVLGWFLEIAKAASLRL